MELFGEPNAEEKTLAQNRDGAASAKTLLVAVIKNCEALVWANPYGLTPQQVFDVLGSAGPELLALKAGILPLLAAAGGDQPGELRPPHIAISVIDGKVMLSEIEQAD